MRGELEMPLLLSGTGIESQQRTGVEVVSTPVDPVEIRPGITGGPVNRIQVGIIGTGQPCRAASILDQLAPGFRAGLALRGYGVGTPQLLAGGRRKRSDVSTHPRITAGDANQDLILQCQRRR